MAGQTEGARAELHRRMEVVGANAHINSRSVW
jgi:hypothetical protein